MFDSAARRLIDPGLNWLGRGLALRGVSANAVTGIGLALGLLSALCIATGFSLLALIPLLAGRFADGLDGAVARATAPSDLGGYLDICADFLFYGAVPMAFVWADPAGNGAAGAFLLTSFYANGASFLGFAVLAEKHGHQTRAQGIKSLYYSNGILEGTETIVFFVALCLWPAQFAVMSWLFGAVTLVTAGLRIAGAARIYGKGQDTEKTGPK